MLDTLKLSLSSFSVKPENKLMIQPASYLESTGRAVGEYPLYYGSRGMVYGSKAYLNSTTFNFDIKPVNNKIYALLHFSVPKVHNGDNYYSVGLGGTQAVLSKVQEELLEAGIETDIEQASLSRVDTFNTLITEEPFDSYSPIFSILKASRQQRREYGSTFLWHNTQQELCIYDKNKEAEIRGVAPGAYPAQSMRFEYRLLNKRKIEAIYGFSTVRELPARWSFMREQYSRVWKKLFSLEVGEFEVLASKQVEAELRYFREHYGRQYLDTYLKAVGASLFSTRASIEVLKLALSSLESDRVTVWRKVKQVEELSSRLELLREEPASNKTLSILYSELKDNICLN